MRAQFELPNLTIDTYELMIHSKELWIHLAIVIALKRHCVSKGMAKETAVLQKTEDYLQGLIDLGKPDGGEK